MPGGTLVRSDGSERDSQRDPLCDALRLRPNQVRGIPDQIDHGQLVIVLVVIVDISQVCKEPF
jgi:hypothetical protein